MHTDIWYDLAIRELSDLSDPATEKLMQAAAETLVAPEAEAPAARPEVPSRG